LAASHTRLRHFKEWDVGVGVFPEREEIFVGGERPDAGGVGIRVVRGSRLQSVRPSHSQMRQRSRPAVPDDAAVAENLLTRRRQRFLVRLQIHRVEAGALVRCTCYASLTRYRPANRSLRLARYEQEALGGGVFFEGFKVSRAGCRLARLHLDFAESEANLELVAHEAVPV
jgi:hypothetical protein